MKSGKAQDISFLYSCFPYFKCRLLRWVRMSLWDRHPMSWDDHVNPKPSIRAAIRSLVVHLFVQIHSQSGIRVLL